MRSRGGIETPDGKKGELGVMFASTPSKKNTDNVTYVLLNFRAKVVGC